jgi:Domain of unknown function (DUF5122) beta-propeller
MRNRAPSARVDGRRVSAALLGTFVAAICAAALPATAQAGADLAPCVPDGTVSAIAHANGNTYIGGQFAAVGQRSGSGVPLARSGVGGGGGTAPPCQASADPESSGSAVSGQPVRPFPEVSGGSVDAAIPDGQGGWYIGGSFTSVGGQAREGLARINADGSVAAGVGDPGAPNGGNGIACASNPTCAVYALALDPNQNVLYVGGSFDGVGSPGNITSPSPNLAAIDAGSGAAVAGSQQSSNWNPPAPDGPVNALATIPVTVNVSSNGGVSATPSRMSILIIGGSFAHAGAGGGGTQTALAQLGAVWGVGATQSCSGCTATSPQSPVSMGGALVASAAGSSGSPWNPTSAASNAFAPGPSNESAQVSAVAVGQPLQGDAGASPPTAACTATTSKCVEFIPVYAAGSPATGSPVQAFQLPLVTAASPTSSVVAGEVTGGPAYTWGVSSPNPGPALTAGSDGNTSVSAVSLVPAPDLGTPATPASKPQPPRVYYGGDFTEDPSAGNPQSAAPKWSNLAEAQGVGDPSTTTQKSAVDPQWTPALNAPVTALAIDASGTTDVVYTGGQFTASSCGQAAGVTCNYAAAFQGANGTTSTALANWTPGLAGGPVNVLALSDASAQTPSVYAGGSFSSTGAVARSNLAAFDPSGALLGWNPGATLSGPSSGCGNGGSTPQVDALAANGSTVYAGGVFDTAGGSTACNLAALDGSSGQPVGGFAPPNPNRAVLSLASTGNALYAGGQFTQIGDQSRNAVAKLDPSSGAVDSRWNPGATPTGTGSQPASVNAIAAGCGTVYVGGDFSAVGGKSRSDLASLDPSSGAATPWNPSSSSYVFAIQPVDGRVYVSGNFSSVGGSGGPYVAAIDSSTGKASTSFYSSARYTTPALALAGSTLFEGQTFGGPGGADGVQNLIAVQADPSAASYGRPLDSDINSTSDIDSDSPFDPYASGDPDGNGDSDTPAPAGDVLALSAYGPELYVGGDFTGLGTRPQHGFAAIPLPTNVGTNAVNCVTPAPSVQLSGSGAFGDELIGTSSAPHALTVTNVGTAPLAVPAAGVALVGVDIGEYLVTQDGCSSQTLAPGGSCTIDLAFAPRTVGAHNGASLQVADNAAGSPQAVALSGTGLAPPTAQIRRPAPPALTGFAQSHPRWREHAPIAHARRGRARRRRSSVPVGTTFSFSLGERARVTLIFTQKLSGRIRNHRCVNTTFRNRRRPRCTRIVFAGTLTLAAKQGRNRLAFDGKLDRRRRLKPGTYTVYAIAAGAGGASAPHRLTFTIVA